MTGPADGLYVGRGIKNDSEISDPALGRLELPLLKWGARGTSTFGRKNQAFGFRPVEFEVPLRSPGGGVGSYIGDTDVNFGGAGRGQLGKSSTCRRDTQGPESGGVDRKEDSPD